MPPTRSDVLHACDVAEDVAVAFGFNNVAEALPGSALVGRELPINQLTELLRVDVAAAGFTEVLTWALCSRAENFEQMRNKSEAGGGAVEIGNPATQEFQVRADLRSNVGPLVLRLATSVTAKTQNRRLCWQVSMRTGSRAKGRHGCRWRARTCCRRRSRRWPPTRARRCRCACLRSATWSS